jgi:hypothetical protein
MAFSNVSMWLFVSVCFCLSSSGLLDIESTVGLESVHDDTAKTMGLPELVAYFAEVADVVDANASASNDSTSTEEFSNPMVVQSKPELELNVESEPKKKTKKFVYDVISRLLGWEMEAYDAHRSQFSQDSVSGKTLSFWFVTACSNSFAVAFGLKAALFGVHPKFYFSRLMVRSIAFHIIVGSLEFVWMVFMYLSVPSFAYTVALVVLDSVQNVTIWLQMRNSSGSKLVTNACYLYCLWVKVALDVLLLVRAPFSRDIVFAIYFILSAFTFTRIAGIPFKRLKLFKGMVYTAAVFTATMITSAMAFGQLGPFSLYCFLIGYAVYATHCKKVHSAKVTRKMETKWDSVSQRNPFDFKAEAPNSLMRKSLDSALSQSAEGRARVVFDVIAERENAQCIDKAQLARLLCPSGVVMSEVEKSFAELCDDKSEGIAFAVFLQRLPSVWQWYFEYMAEAVANFDERSQ